MSSLPQDFSWLSPADRPTREEVEDYANVIAAAEGPYARSEDARRHEAELQLWIWRSEARQRPPARSRRRVASLTRIFPAPAH